MDMIWKLLLLAGVGLLLAESDLRNGRWFFPRRTITKVVYEKQPITACVEIQPSIKPCKYVRQLEIDPTKTLITLVKTAFPYLPDHHEPTLSNIFLRSSKMDIFDPTVKDSWAAYFGLDDITITQTKVQEMFTNRDNLDKLITFSVRGCKPSKLPFDLPICPTKTPVSSKIKDA